MTYTQANEKAKELTLKKCVSKKQYQNMVLGLLLAGIITSVVAGCTAYYNGQQKVLNEIKVHSYECNSNIYVVEYQGENYIYLGIDK